MKIRQGKQTKPRRTLIYGDNGIGKSTWAASWPKPLVLNLEDGTNNIECDSTERITTLEAYHGALAHVINNETEYQSIITDTVDWLEKLIFTHVAGLAGKKTVEEIGYGKGYEMVELQWRRLITGWSMIWESGRHLVFSCHSKISKFKQPEGEAYDYYSPAIHDKGSEIICQWCDEVLLAKYKVGTRQIDEGFGTKRNIAYGGERVLCTQEAATHVAKNRLGLPPEMSLDFSEYQEFIGNINGLVTNGSSKKKVVNNG